MESNKIKKLEDQFNMATSLVTDLETLVKDIDENQLEIVDTTTGEITTCDESIMNLVMLKQDFTLVRNNIIKVVLAGQRILESASNIGFDEIKAGQIMALAQLQTALGSNIKLLMDCYKDIAVIEKSRKQAVVAPTVNTGGVPVVQHNENNIFVGSGDQLLKFINETSAKIIEVK
jgi:hypothetical protein